METISFVVEGTRVVGDLYLPGDLSKPVPGVVTGSGFAGVKEMLLPDFAKALAEAGFATLAVDFRGFGGSSGEPRQQVDPQKPVQDMRAGLDWLAADPRIDASRLGVFGPSMAGGHTLTLASTDPRIACAVALIPFVKVSTAERSAGDALGRLVGKESATIPAAGHPGDWAVMTSDGALEWVQEMSHGAPLFRNEVTLASLPLVASYHSARHAADIKAPLLAVLAADDKLTPPALVREALADVPSVEFLEFPDTHFELFKTYADDVTKALVAFFRRHLTPQAGDRAL